jgi:hypothetical protein
MARVASASASVMTNIPEAWGCAPRLASVTTRCASEHWVGRPTRKSRLNADSDEGGHLFQSDRGHHSNLMAASLASSRGPVLVVSRRCSRGQIRSRFAQPSGLAPFFSLALLIPAVVRFRVAFAILVDCQLLPLATQIQDLQNAVEDLVKTSFGAGSRLAMERCGSAYHRWVSAVRVLQKTQPYPIRCRRQKSKDHGGFYTVTIGSPDELEYSDSPRTSTPEPTSGAFASE